MIFDDFRNLLGCEPVDSEILYQRIINQRTGMDWPALWREIDLPWRVGPVWAAKVMFHYLPYLSQFIAGRRLTKTPPMRSFAPATVADFMNEFAAADWVHVRRRDVFAQAVSMYLAETTNVWEDRDGKSAQPALVRPGYDRGRLLAYAGELLAERRQWPLLFAHFGIAPMTIDYEDAAAFYPHYLSPLLRQLRLEPAGPPPPRRLFKLGDALNEVFARRLQADYEAVADAVGRSLF